MLFVIQLKNCILPHFHRSVCNFPQCSVWFWYMVLCHEGKTLIFTSVWKNIFILRVIK